MAVIWAPGEKTLLSRQAAMKIVADEFEHFDLRRGLDNYRQSSQFSDIAMRAESLIARDMLYIYIMNISMYISLYTYIRIYIYVYIHMYINIVYICRYIHLGTEDFPLVTPMCIYIVSS